MKYIHGNVVSRTSQRFITNLLSATAARVVEEPGDSSDDTDDFDYEFGRKPAGNMELIQNTLNGISSRNDDNGVEGIGRYATVIQLGRNLWQSPPLSAAEAKATKEILFDDGSLPPATTILKAAQEAVKKEEERLRPFSGSTHPWAQYIHTDLAKIFNDWFTRIGTEEETPNKEQLAVLKVSSCAASYVLFPLHINAKGKENRFSRTWSQTRKAPQIVFTSIPKTQGRLPIVLYYAKKHHES